MMLSKIFKNRKAMTPLMIGVIVAASVVAVLFIVLAAVMPFTKHDLYMQIRPGTINPYGNDSKGLQFYVMCDYTDGEVWKVDIVVDGEVEAVETLASPVVIPRNNQSYFQITNFVIVGTTTDYVFTQGAEYTLRVYYRPVGSAITDKYFDTLFEYED